MGTLDKKGALVAAEGALERFSAVAFLACPDPGWITGQVLRVDGGLEP